MSPVQEFHDDLTGQDLATRRAQSAWVHISLSRRIEVMTKARHELTSLRQAITEAIPSTLARTRADTLASEILPLLAACVFLENNAAHILRSRKLRKRLFPLWLAGIQGVVERHPFGVILIIAPSNYPFFLPGVQALQALTAGNAVVWKPGEGGMLVATLFAEAMERAGLPVGLLRVTDDSSAAAIAEIEAGPNKIFFTGSARVGKIVLQRAAQAAVPVVAELSGCDAVVALPSANAEALIDALAFGMRLNGSATCMAPRRLILVDGGPKNLAVMLIERFSKMDGTPCSTNVRTLLSKLLEDASNQGAKVIGDPEAALLKPLLVVDGRPEMAIAQADIFAPVLTIIEVPDLDGALQAEAVCPFGLTVSIFGHEKTARSLGSKFAVGTVLINDLIVGTADPRMPFGGRRASGFGSTRGAEGLLEMTAPKTTIVRTGGNQRQYQPTGEHHEAIFDSMIAMGHSADLRRKIAGFYKLVTAGRKLVASEKTYSRGNR